MRISILIITLFSFYFVSCSERPGEKKYKEIVINLNDNPEMKAFVDFWKIFSFKFYSLDTAIVKKNTLDSIWLWGDHISSAEFMRRYSTGYSAKEHSGILDTAHANYSSIGCHPSPYVAEAIKQRYSDACVCRTVECNLDTVGNEIECMRFAFLETTKGFRLFGINIYHVPLSRDYNVVDTTAKAN